MTRIAIIGSGIAGLHAAFRLADIDDCQISIIEKRKTVGLSENTLQWESESGPQYVDTPLRLMNRGQWPEVASLYEDLAVDMVEVDASLSFSDSTQASYLNLDFAKLFRSSAAMILNKQTRKIAQDIVRFRSIGLHDLAASLDYDVNIETYLAKHNFSDSFQYGFLYPVLSSTVCTCSYDALSQYPARIILESLAKITTPNQADKSVLFRARHGMQDVTSRLIRESVDLRLDTSVESIVDHHNEAVLTFRVGDSSHLLSESFDHVIVATQANQANRLLSNKSQNEQEMLDCFNYESIEVIVHSDPSLMPASRQDWKAFNMISQTADGSPQAMCSIWINQFAPNLKLPSDIFQTINPLFEPDSELMELHIKLQRPIVNSSSLRGWNLIEELHQQPNRRIWFVGSYASHGVPLLETGVVSCQSVVDAIKNVRRLTTK